MHIPMHINKHDTVAVNTMKKLLACFFHLTGNIQFLFP
ncbi:MAG: hypothetical protein JWO58_312 [Chitinophagaceae bacterium]|nr:hypothetical protein [Chitinophagaceae bacterium]